MNGQSTFAETTQIGRTDYRDGGVLSAAALAGDSEANVAAWKTHQRAAHIGGIVSGLYVTIEELPIRIEKNDEAENKAVETETVRKVKVHPGAAIDSDGRMLLVDHESEPDGKTEAGKNFAVWLRYAVEAEVVPDSDLQRYREAPRLEVTALDDIPNTTESFASSGVLLAYLRPEKENAGVPKVDASCRRYVGAVGNRIDAPSGRARVVLGPQFPRDPRRFAIGVQSAPEQPIRDVFTWESTGTIRLSARTSVALPQEKQKTDDIEQPPVMIVGSPSVNFTPEDILDACRVRELLLHEDGRRFRISQMLSDGDCPVPDETTCLFSLNRQVIRTLNRLIQTVDDYMAALLRPTYGPNWMDWLLDIVPEKIAEFYWRRERMPMGPLLSGSYLCRVALDHFLGDAIQPLKSPLCRGLFFNGSVPVEQEPPASRIHLVEFKKDGQTFRQLRITIRDPGKENQPHRYRCSIGTALDCTHPPAPTPASEIWNRQTSWPRGILSVLADKSVDIHDQLNVYPAEGSILPGLILKLEPDSDSGSGAGASGGASGGSSIPATQILGNAVIWEDQRVERKTPQSLTVGGRLRNLTDLDVESLQVLVSIYGKSDTDHSPTRTELFSKRSLGRKASVGIDTLAAPGSLIVQIPDVFSAITVVVSLLVMGVNSHNSIICTQYTEELPVPLPPPAPTS